MDLIRTIKKPKTGLDFQCLFDLFAYCSTDTYIVATWSEYWTKFGDQTLYIGKPANCKKNFDQYIPSTLTGLRSLMSLNIRLHF